MTEELPWFRALGAEERSWIGLIASAGISSFVDWFAHPEARTPLSAEVFGTAPPELAGVVTLQQTVEMVRTTIDVVEQHVTDIVGRDDAPAIREAVMRYAREIAFAAADVYARAAEQRGAWDARLEALAVDSVLRGEADDEVRSRATAIGWGATSGVCVVLGHTPPADPEAAVGAIKRSARSRHVDVLCAVQGDRLVVILGGVGARNFDRVTAAVADHFGPGAVVTGPVTADLLGAGGSARAALAGLRAAPAWPTAPRPVASADLLPERAVAGDGQARRQLVADVYRPLTDANPSLAQTLSTYFDEGGSLEATARRLFVHPNTVRYRLRRVAEVTGYTPGHPRGAYALRVALTLGRLVGAS